MNRVTDNLMTFAKIKDKANKNVYEKFTDYFNHYMDEVQKQKIGSYDASLSLLVKEASVHEFMLNEIIAQSGLTLEDTKFNNKTWASHPVLTWATYAVIGSMIDAVLPDVLIADIGIYTEFKSGDFGDSFSFDVEPRDLFYITKSGRNKRHQELQEHNNGQVTVVPVEHDVTVSVSLYRVLSGKENLANFVAKAIRAVESEMTLDAYSAFTTAAATLSAYTNSLYFSGYTQTALVTGGQTVSAFNGGARAIWMGTQLALQNILPTDANYRYELTSKYATMGYVQMSGGYDLLEMKQKADWNNATEFQLALDDTKLFCISPGTNKLIKMCREGSTWAIYDQAYANADLRQATTFKMAWGVGTVWSPVIAVINL